MGWVTLQFHGNEHGSVVGAIAMEKLASVGKSTASPLSRVAATASSGDAVAIGVVVVTSGLILTSTTAGLTAIPYNMVRFLIRSGG